MSENNNGQAVQLKIKQDQDCLIITPMMNEITFKNSKELLQEVKIIVDRESKDLILNMENVEIIDSVSLGTLVAIKKYVKTRECEVGVAKLSHLILELFKLLNFPAVFKIYDSVEEALDDRRH